MNTPRTCATVLLACAAALTVGVLTPATAAAQPCTGDRCTSPPPPNHHDAGEEASP